MYVFASSSATLLTVYTARFRCRSPSHSSKHTRWMIVMPDRNFDTYVLLYEFHDRPK